MRKFWLINYFFTIYFLMVIVSFNSLRYVKNYYFNLWQDIVSLKGYSLYFSFINDFLQFFICFSVLVFVKAQRTTWHLCYILILLLLMVFKAISFFFAAGMYG